MKLEFAVGMLIIAVVFGVLVHCTGCKPAEEPLPPHCYDEGKFTAALVVCASTAPTKGASQTCRKAVQAACGITETP
jgi:hypothetical protein